MSVVYDTGSIAFAKKQQATLLRNWYSYTDSEVVLLRNTWCWDTKTLRVEVYTRVKKWGEAQTFSEAV